MLNSPEKSNRNLLSKEDVFDALYKCCEVNDNDEVSLESILMYISREIGCKLLNSQHIIEELQKKLEEQNQNGWMPFNEVCDIFSSWMDEVAERLNQESIRNDLIQFSPELSPMPHKLPSVKKIVLNGLLRDKSDTLDELLLECEKCGREEDCCEWRNNVSNREEKLTRCYEQKVAELQNLLRQSEDCNSLMQLENESLREKCAVFQGKEQHWIETEEDLKENELQLISKNTLLNEQMNVAEKEIQYLKQQLSRLKSENVKILACNQKLEERVAGKTKIEKMLCETKAQLTDLQFDVHSKDVALLDIETKFENLLQHNKILQERILEFEANNNAALPANENIEQSISEDMLESLAEDYLSLENSDMEYQEIREISTLKDELGACWGQYLLSCEHVSTQTAFAVETIATQTEDLQIAFTKTINCEQPEDNLQNKDSSEAHLVNNAINYCKCEVLIKPLISSNLRKCSKLSSDSECSLVDASIQTIPVQTCNPFSQVESVSCIPGINSNNVKKRHNDFCSTCEMEIYLVVDSSTQTEGNDPRERKLQPVTVKTVARGELTSNNENRMENSCRVMLLVGFASLNDHQLRKNSSFKIVPASRDVVMNKLPTPDYLLLIPRIISYQLSGVSHHLRSAVVIPCKNDLLQDPINGLCNSVTTVSRNVSQHTGVVSSRWCAKWISTNKELVQERPVVHCKWLSVFKLFPLLLLWWMYQEWIQQDDYNWYTESPVWDEIHRVLSSKLELQWRNGPPPQ